MSLSDWNHLARLVRDPTARAAEMRRASEERLVALHGPDGAVAVLGPDDGDFWQLVERTAAGFGPAMVVVTYDGPAWAAAVERRLVALRASAPPELAGAVDELAPAVRDLARAAAADGPAGLDRAMAGVDLTADPLAGPVRRLLVAAGDHFGCPPEPEALARRLGLADDLNG
jgi:hypothetical protein